MAGRFFNRLKKGCLFLHKPDSMQDCPEYLKKEKGYPPRGPVFRICSSDQRHNQLLLRIIKPAKTQGFIRIGQIPALLQEIK